MSISANLVMIWITYPSVNFAYALATPNSGAYFKLHHFLHPWIDRVQCSQRPFPVNFFYCTHHWTWINRYCTNMIDDHHCIGRAPVQGRYEILGTPATDYWTSHMQHSFSGPTCLFGFIEYFLCNDPRHWSMLNEMVYT